MKIIEIRNSHICLKIRMSSFGVQFSIINYQGRINEYITQN
ncbi:Uncharacterized protein dnm_059920 [Desulfonema magnum]|uniref:Uncharacterized protein n=1 Tax=Desulfonema magnum TaxID=45655 RepID=A0A975BQV0_9BACT|nr:Uncharacterized protein dnm_059920 [Desulfonema magnum]